MILVKVFYFLSAFVIFWAVVGYPISLIVLKLLYRMRRLKKDFSYLPTVTVMVVVHNEERIIETKLENLIQLDYPYEKIDYIITSDHSTDRTNDIVREFKSKHPEMKLLLYEVNERRGKTNAQNEAQKLVKSEILIMTDANSILKEDAVRELVSTFTADDICYVAGKLVIVNSEVNEVAALEKTYWDRDTKLRNIESIIQTITAGNGAIYACRNKEYFDFDPIRSHDGAMPRHFALQKKRALFNPDAIAFEKASQVINDEFKRKVRMNRGILKNILPDIRILNIFKYRWYSYFYFGHRTCRYLLWLAHLLLFATNFFLITESWIYSASFVFQCCFIVISFFKMNNKLFKFANYYCMTILAQWVGVFNILTGRAKPFWEKAESTR